MTNQPDDHLDPTIDADRALKGEGTPSLVSASSARVPKQIGKFRIKKLIATGGMGAVYQGIQAQPRRTVAIKLMKSGVTSASALRRFQYESQLLARLKHPGIAEVYDAGTHEAHDGSVPYFVMEYIAGAKRITDFARDKNLNARDRLKLFSEAASAVHHGHTKGVIHRDLKPDNVLVDSFGKVKVIDFGVARATDSDMAVTTLQTDIGQLIGTVQYMSPEQVEADPDNLDTRSDVYSLGVILYELLCGRLPYDVSKMKVYDATRVVREQDPMSLSSVNGDLKGDVETIVAKALEKDRDRRYQSAQELATDIQRYLIHEPINARPPSITYQLRVFARRNKGLMTGVAAVFAALLLGLAGMSYLYVDTVRARNDATREKKVAEREKKVAEGARQQAERNQALALAAEQLASEQRDTLNRNLYFAQMNLASQAAKLPSGLRTIDQLTSNWRQEHGEPDLRGWEWYYLRSLLKNDNVLIESRDHRFHQVRFSPDGKLLATDGAGFAIMISDAATGKTLRKLRGNQDSVRDLAWSPKGQHLASAGADHTVRVWDPHTGRLVSELSGHNKPVNSVAWHPDGAQLASGSSDRTIKIWDWDGVAGLESATFTDHTSTIVAVRWNSEATRFASTSGDGTVIIWDQIDGFVPRDTYHFNEIPTDLAWSPNGERLAVTGFGGDLKIWDAETGHQRTTPAVHNGAAGRAVAWSPDGLRIVSGGSDNTLALMDAQNGEKILTFTGHTNHIYDIDWSPIGSRIVSAGEDRTIRFWNADRDPSPDVLRGHNKRLQHLAWNPDGLRLVSSSADRSVRVWDVNTRNTILTLPADHSTKVAWSPDGSKLATSSRDSGVNVWRFDGDSRATPSLMRDSIADEGATTFAWSPDGTRIASGYSDCEIGVWDTENGDLIKTYTLTTDAGDAAPHTGNINWSEDGAYLASAGGEQDSALARLIFVIDVATGRVIHRMSGHEAYLLELAWRPKSNVLASGSYDHTVRLWDAVAGKMTHTLSGHSNFVPSLAWSPTANRLASASLDQSVRIWDAQSGIQALSFDLGGIRYSGVAWSPDGKRLATAAPGDNTSIRIWDARPGYAEEAARQNSLTK